MGGKWYYFIKVDLGEKFDGVVSWYGFNFYVKKISNGEIYNMYVYIVAYKILFMNIVVKVINVDNNLSIIVRINDRGFFVSDCIIDLFNVVVRDIDMVKKGIVSVCFIVLGFGGVIFM